jgi:transposase-like protein
MSRRTDLAVVPQAAGREVDRKVPERVSQMLLPLVAGLLQTKQDMMSFIWKMGHGAVDAVFKAEAEALLGPAGKRQDGRDLYRWGTVKAEFPLGGRRVTMPCPRVRRRGEHAIGRGGSEVRLPSVEQFRAADPLPERVLSQILLGVSTRDYEASLEPLPEQIDGHGAKKSSASRHLVAITRKKLQEEFSRPLGDVELAAMMIDGVVIAGQSAVLALGITIDGSKLPLGLAVGSTENAALCTSVLQGLLDRGLRIDHRILVVIDGAKGLRRAAQDVLGDLVMIQRCQNHKRRNILQLVPERCHPYVNRMLSDAWSSNSSKTAREILRRLAGWLERDGHDSAAASLKEGFEETLTVVALGLSGSLRAFFATTNAIENVMSSVRDVTGNVKRWRRGDMINRWLGLSFLTAAKRFRRIKGFRQMPVLVQALRSKEQAFVDAKMAIA